MKVDCESGTLTLETRSADGTEAAGRILGSKLAPGDVVALIGELGAGKTCFTRGVAAAAGVGSANTVVSPSFTILNEYAGRVPVYHFDFYRLDAPGRELDGECREYFSGAGIVVIEWAEKVAELLPDDCVLVHLKFEGESDRMIVLQGLGERSREQVMDCVEEMRILESRQEQ